MRRALIVLVVVALLMVVLAAPAFAGGNAYGKTIKSECNGWSFGQLVKLSPHDFPPVGAKAFVEDGLLAFHCSSPE